ncbi:MAG TPA: DUF4382 domain-containing protein, partial [Flavisolibacter sp.]|nr:DUF4382 domain-containing protein [Flavisolibacter sp.]
MKTQATFKALFACIPLSLFIFVACQKGISEDPDKTGTANIQSAALKIYLTDHQTPVFDSVFINMQKLEVKLEDDTLVNGGWFTLAINPGIYNILRFRNGLATLFVSGNLPNSRVRKVRLTLGAQNSVMKSGQSFPLK